MGQYYHPALFRADKENCTHDNCVATFEAWDYNNGLKLMEHSWVTNRLVGAVMCKIREMGKARVVWSGDYADGELQRLAIAIKDKKTTVEASADVLHEIYMRYAIQEDETKRYTPTEVDAELKKLVETSYNELANISVEGDENLYHILSEHKLVKKVAHSNLNPRYIINHSKGEYVDIKHTPIEEEGEWKGRKYVMRIHPLPLLTCEGCGRGGGDYHRDPDHPTYKYIGAWARDIISVGYKKEAVEGFKEIKPDFTEKD